MNPKCVLCLILLTIAAIYKSVQGFQSSGATTKVELESEEPLAKAIFELFRRDLEVGAGQPSKRLENNELKLIRGAKFRTIQDATISLNAQYNYSDFHFFGTTIPSDYHLYLLVDESNKPPKERLQSVMLGRCQVGRPPGSTNGQGVENVLSATDKELESWLAVNEETSDLDNKLCDHSSKLTNLVMNFSEWGTHILSNYTLFEWSTQRKPDSSPPPSYLYLRGKIQRITKYSEYFGADLFKIKEIKDVWLIATNRPINFSAARSSDDKVEPFTNGNEENCKTGPQIEMDADGNVQYVIKASLSSDTLQLFADPDGEILSAPHGELCVKTCASAPLRPTGWFENEVRCSQAKYASQDRFADAESSSRLNLMMSVVMNAIVKFGALDLVHGTINNEVSEWVNSMNSVTLNGDGQERRRICLPLEARYEPIIFSHRRRLQRNLYYRFELMPLGAKRCCCY